jgi:hypothetical protein
MRPDEHADGLHTLAVVLLVVIAVAIGVLMGRSLGIGG